MHPNTPSPAFHISTVPNRLRARGGDAHGQGPARPVTPPTASPAAVPASGVRVVEWVVFLVDPNVPLANDAAAFRSTLLGFVRGRRAQAAADVLDHPSPVGLIRLIAPKHAGKTEEGAPAGAAAADTYDVLLRAPGGRFLAAWPAGKPRSERQLWEKVALADTPSRQESVEAGHWFDALRRGGGAWLRGGERGERFLLYDVQCPLGVPLRIRVPGGPSATTKPSATTAPAGEAYEVANAGALPLRGLQLYKPVGKGWRVGGIEVVKPAKNVKPPDGTSANTTQPAPTPAAPAGPAADLIKELFTEATGLRVGAAPVPQPGTTPKPPATTQPAAGVAPEDWVPVSLAAGDPAPADAVLAPWRDRLARAGLDEPDREAVIGILRHHALDPDQLTAVYQVDQADLDRVLPLEVVPTPAGVVRVGLAVVRNVDPDAGARIAKWIAQLGSDSWEQREAAEQALTKLGAGARPKLQEALKEKDLEVVYRVERLLAKAEGKPQP